MKGHRRLLTRPWILSVALVAFIASHLMMYYILQRTVLSAAVISGLVILAVIKHLELLSPL